MVIESLTDSIVSNNLILRVFDRYLALNSGDPEGEDDTVDDFEDKSSGFFTCVGSGHCTNVQMNFNTVNGA